MRTTEIEWTEHTWNPFVGCSIHSAGCTNCYAMKQANRIQSFGTVPHYEGITQHVNGKATWSGKISRASDTVMHKPLKIKKPSLIFVNSMSDFFHDNADYYWMLEAIEIMKTCSIHTFQILTKRPENIAKFLKKTGITFPNNVWIGTTVEREDVKNRIEILSSIPASVRFISFEPLIGPIGEMNLENIDWVITGGESGPKCRACDPNWVREIVRYCDLYDVPVFHKQWGHYKNNPLCSEQSLTENEAKIIDPNGKGGSLLDGKTLKRWPHSFIADKPVDCSHRAKIRSQFSEDISIA